MKNQLNKSGPKHETLIVGRMGDKLRLTRLTHGCHSFSVGDLDVGHLAGLKTFKVEIRRRTRLGPQNCVTLAAGFSLILTRVSVRACVS